MTVGALAIVYAAYALVGLAVLARFGAARAVWPVLLGGWIFLPVGHYPDGAADAVFPYWITGLALPSEMLLAKSWVAPVTALVGSAIFGRERRAGWRRWRPNGFDGVVAAWCLWPSIAGALGGASSDPAGPVASAYLAGTWGATWALGRRHADELAAQRRLLVALAVSALALLPIALDEGLGGPAVYGLVFGPHPFRADGLVRYVGLRPLGFFENGNQYGLWICLCALAAAWLAVTDVAPAAAHRRAVAIAAVTSAMALAAQSVGALGLALAGAGLLALFGRVAPRRLAFGFLGVAVLAGVVYLSGRVPIERIGRGTAFGQHAIELLRGVGRGSFAWRISQDQKLLADALRDPFVGSGLWDWWRSHGIRPWGFAMLVLGQYGLVGLGLAGAALLAPALRTAWHAPRRNGWRPAGGPMLLATLIGLTALDALLNSFVFYPALLMAGGLASMPREVPRG